MSVHLTRIYTRTGDQGTTALSDFSRVPKYSPRIEAIGAIDEVNSDLGVLLSLAPDWFSSTVSPAEKTPLSVIFSSIQNELFDAGADLSLPLSAESAKDDHGASLISWTPLRLQDFSVQRLESWCDEFNAELSSLNSFILPGGHPVAAQLHICRASTRRAERRLWAAIHAEPEEYSPVISQYLNRLSDLFFILCRWVNKEHGVQDVLWRPGDQSSHSEEPKPQERA